MHDGTWHVDGTIECPPCKRPAAKDTAVAAMINNIIPFIRAIHGAICNQISQVLGMSEDINY